MKRVLLPGILAGVHNFLIRNEVLVFGLLLLISMVHIWLTRYVISLDGPQHLYFAHVLVELIKGNEVFREFFRVNDVIVGYWTGHFFLGIFKLFLPGWLAEKFFLTTYVIGMFYSFRYFIRSLLPEKNNLLIFLVFPFVFHNYLLLGYYSFSIAAIFYFLAVGSWLRKSEAVNVWSMVIFAGLALGVFLSHGLVFVFFAASLGILFMTDSIRTIWFSKEPARFKIVVNRFLKLLLSLSPSLILWIIYIRKVMDINPTITPSAYSTGELVEFLLRIRPLVGFNHQQESPAYIAIFILLMILGFSVLVRFIGKLRKGEYDLSQLMNSRNSWLLIMGMFLGFYFFLPDRISAGSLTNRFGLFFFFSLIIFLSSQKYPGLLQVLTVLVLIGTTANTRIYHHSQLKKLNREILEFRELSVHMEEGTSMVSINTTNNWLHAHTQLLVVDDLSVVFLNSTQCVGQFPIVWNENSLPRCFVGKIAYRLPGAPDVSETDHRIEQADYVTAFYYKRLLEEEQYADWREILKNYYELVTVSSGELAALYRRKTNLPPVQEN